VKVHPCSRNSRLITALGKNMSSNPLTPAFSAASTSTSISVMHPSYQAWKHQRVLSCTLCQQKKIKCNRKIPCNHCTRTQSKCIPSTMTPRRRRFPERELLERLRKYEGMLREHKVKFEPLHHGREGLEGFLSAEGDGDPDGASRDVPMTCSSSSAQADRPHDIRYAKSYHFTNAP
jgi:hypothetical protein